MIISEKQIIQLIQILVDSLPLSDGGDSPFNYSTSHRRKLADEIITQQSEELKEVK